MYQPNPEDVINQLGRLSERQRQVLRFVCERKSYKQIATDLGISVNGIKSHVQNIYIVLNLKALVTTSEKGPCKRSIVLV